MRILMLLVLVPLAAVQAQADLIYPKKGRATKGKLWEQTAEGVTYNRYRTGIRGVTHGTVTLLAKKVKKVVVDPHPHRSFWRKAEELAGGSADNWVALGLDTDKKKLKRLARWAFVEALVRDANHEGARKALGSGRLKEVLATDPRLNGPLKEKLADYLTLDDASARNQARGELAKLGCAWPSHYLERAWRSAREKKGRREDVVLTLRSKEHKGVYTLFVPEKYDPLVPTPLVLGLHGGGRGGKDRKAVVGSGKGAMNFYQRGADKLGWIVVCPTAVVAPWGEKANFEFVMAVVDEMRMLFNVDENRIYLTGHSMGGYGTWAFGPEYPHIWAAIAPMAGGGARGLSKLKKSLTGVYLYHGANDSVVGVGSSRATGEKMLNDDMDFVYAEIPDSGHGFPPSVATEMWEFFKVRRLATTPRRTRKGKVKISQLPFSSFTAKVKKEEIKYFGPLGGEATAGSDKGKQLKALIKNLKAGGGLAEKAVPKLGALKTASAAGAVGKVLGNTRYTEDTRRFAAQALGKIGLTGGLKSLKKAVSQKELSVVVAACEAMGVIPDQGNAKVFSKAVRKLADEFDRKKMGARMRFSDFDAYMKAIGRIVTAMAAAEDRAVTSSINTVAERFLLVSIDVPKLARAGHFPSRVRRQLASEIMAALEKLADPASKPVVKTLSTRSDLGVDERARELLLKL